MSVRIREDQTHRRLDLYRDQQLHDGFNHRLGVPTGVEVIGQRSSNRTTANIPLVGDEGHDVTLASSFGQHFPGGPSNLKLLSSFGFVVSNDLVVCLGI